MRLLMPLVTWFTREDRLIAAALVRVGLGAVLLSMYLFHYRFRGHFWGPDGFLSYEMFTEMMKDGGSFSVYQLTRSKLGFELLFHSGLLVTVLWLAGFWTRFTGLLTYVFAFSLWERNGLILDGGDNILILVLFFLLFARTDRHLSLARALRRRFAPSTGLSRAGRTPPGSRWRLARRRLHEGGTVLHNAAVVAILAQLSFLYLTSALYKVQGEMWQSGVALYYVLRVQEFTLPGIANYIYENPLVITALSYMTVMEQLSYPFMLLNRWTKRASVFIAVNMHLGIALLMGLVSFSTVMITLQAAAFRDSEYRAVLQWARALAEGALSRMAAARLAVGSLFGTYVAGRVLPGIVGSDATGGKGTQ